MKRALVVGGANGIGLSIATELAAREDIEKVYIVDKVAIAEEFMNPKFEGHQFDLTQEDYSIFDKFKDILSESLGVSKKTEALKNCLFEGKIPSDEG